MPKHPLAELIRYLSALTALYKIDWRPTSEDEEFQASLTRNSVRVFQSYNDIDRELAYGLRVYNEKGQVIEEIWPHQVDDDLSDANSMFYKLYIGARRKAMNTDKVIEDMVLELKQLSPLDG